jgi:hypothetical protein
MEEPSAEELLAKAKILRHGKSAPGYGDDKQICEWCDIVTLLDAGASALTLNQEQVGGEQYLHEVKYKGHVFTATTNKPLEIFKKYQR